MLYSIDRQSISTNQTILEKLKCIVLESQLHLTRTLSAVAFLIYSVFRRIKFFVTLGDIIFLALKRVDIVNYYDWYINKVVTAFHMADFFSKPSNDGDKNVEDDEAAKGTLPDEQYNKVR